MREIKVVDFVPYPGGRTIASGPYSGEWFRDMVLVPQLTSAIKEGVTLTVVLDGAPGYGVSFLEEAFGGLVRVHGFTSEQMESLEVVARTKFFQTFERLSQRYVKDALSVKSRNGSTIAA